MAGLLRQFLRQRHTGTRLSGSSGLITTSSTGLTTETTLEGAVGGELRPLQGRGSGKGLFSRRVLPRSSAHLRTYTVRR
jgi:hypothetical protein